MMLTMFKSDPLPDPDPDPYSCRQDRGQVEFAGSISCFIAGIHWNFRAICLTLEVKARDTDILGS